MLLSARNKSQQGKGNPSEGPDERVRVMVRVRPPLGDEVGGVLHCSNNANNKITVLRTEQGPQEFTFDRVFGPNATQAEVYDAALRPVVEDVGRGYNGTIMAYGQTGAGKTYTLTNIQPDCIGMMPRAADAVFNDVQNDMNHECHVFMSYVQIYMEIVKDLLMPTSTNLVIREDANGVYVSGVKEQEVTDTNDCLKLLQLGEQNRMYAFTSMNAQSSRSHCLVMIKVVKKSLQTNGKSKDGSGPPTAIGGKEYLQQQVTVGRLYIVDLAGSERLKKSQSSGVRANEARSINLSLTMLGKCINSRADPQTTHVPFRDSKLTRLLQDSLGGNAKTVMIVNVSDARKHTQETAYSMQFGQRAMCVRNKPIVNEHIDYRAISDTLMAQLDATHNSQAALEAKLNRKQTELENLTSSLKKEQQKFQHILDNLKTEKEERASIADTAAKEKQKALEEHEVKLARATQQLTTHRVEKENLEKKLKAALEEGRIAKETHQTEIKALKKRLQVVEDAKTLLQKKLVEAKEQTRIEVERAKTQERDAVKGRLDRIKAQLTAAKQSYAKQYEAMTKDHKQEQDRVKRAMQQLSSAEKYRMEESYKHNMDQLQSELDETVVKLQNSVHQVYTWQEKYRLQEEEAKEQRNTFMKSVIELEQQLQQSNDHLSDLQHEAKRLRNQTSQQSDMILDHRGARLRNLATRRQSRRRTEAAVVIQKYYRRFQKSKLEDRIAATSRELHQQQAQVDELHSSVKHAENEHKQYLSWIGKSLVTASMTNVQSCIDRLINEMIVPSKQLSSLGTMNNPLDLQIQKSFSLQTSATDLPRRDTAERNAALFTQRLRSFKSGISTIASVDEHPAVMEGPGSATGNQPSTLNVPSTRLVSQAYRFST